DVEREIVDGPNLPRSRWREIALALDTSSNADRKQADRLREALTLTGIGQVDSYLGVFLTETERTPRATVTTNNFISRNPAFGRLFEQEIVRLNLLIERRRAVTI